MTIYTQSGPVLEAELRADAELIDRKLIRLSCRYRPDETGVRWRVYVRLTYRVLGELFAYEEPVGTLWMHASDEERRAIQDKVTALADRVRDLAEELSLELRGATHD